MASHGAFPETLGDFRLVRKIGQGGMGVVFEAEQISLSRSVALKILPPNFALDEGKVERFQREARSLAKLVHPNIMPIYQVGDTDGYHYFAMRLVDGLTLAELLQSVRALSSTRFEGSLITKVIRERPFSSRPAPDGVTVDLGDRNPALDPTATETREITGPRVVDPQVQTGETAEVQATVSFDRGYISTVCSMIAIVGEALETAHQHGIVHRDIKPSNLMIESEEENVLLTDFGLAWEVGASHLTQTGQTAGTPAYMSPEQILGKEEVDATSDVYSLGVTLYEFLTHRLPFSARTAEEMNRKVLLGHPLAPRRINPRLSRDLETIVLKAIDRWPERRYSTAALFAEDLRRFLSLEPIRARPLGAGTRAFRFLRRNRGLTTSLISSLVVILVVFGIALGRQSKIRETVERSVTRGEAAVLEGDFEEAQVRLAMARELAPDSPRVRRFHSELELALLEDDLGEYQRTQAEMAELYGVVLEERGRFQSEYMTVDQSRRYHANEKRLEDLIQNCAVLVEGISAKLALADEADPSNPSVDRFRLETLVVRRAEALRRGEASAKAFFESGIRDLDRDGKYASLLDDRGTLRIATDPPGAEVYLFRCVEESTNRLGAPRLVPSPCDASGQLLSEDPLFVPPGAVVLEVVSRLAGVPAETELAPGDLITAVDALPLEETLVAGPLAFHDVFSEAELAPLDRLLMVDGVDVTSVYDFERWVGKVANGERDLDLVFECGGERREVQVRFSEFGRLLRVRPQRLDEALSRFAVERDRRFAVVRLESEPRVFSIELAPGDHLGVELCLTANPVVCGEGNLVGTSPSSLEVRRGSYVVVCRAPGREFLRTSARVRADVEVDLSVDLYPEGTTPAGFVRIPEGTVRFDGDPQAFKPRRDREEFLESFFLSRFEVTWGEYFRFVNDRAEKLRSRGGSRSGNRRPAVAGLFPRAHEMEAREIEVEGSGEQLRYFPPYFRQDDHPVYALPLGLAHQYLDWLNRRDPDSEFEYFLPTRAQLEKAARGADSRAFPWGTVFSWQLCNSFYSRSEFGVKIAVEPVGSFLGDESVYGVRDLAGSVREWTESFELVYLVDEFGEEKATPYHFVFGGSYMMESEARYHSGSNQKRNRDRFSPQIGFRVAARLRD